jgi:hypothetical protein
MDRTGLKAVLLTMLFVFSTSLASVEINLTESTNERSTQQGALGVVDVPTYRIGDEWVYETKFDVAQLIAQANVSASLNTLTGDTVNTVTDIIYTTDENGDTVLAYEIDISGGFSSGTNGANLEGVPGRLEIDYDGTDLLRARDLATIESDFNLDVTFAPYNIGFLAQTLGDILFENTYTPAKERHDFPLRNGDQWYMGFEAETVVTGTSNYFDPSEFDTVGDENNSWQVIKNEAPAEDGDTPQYTGCDDSYKIAEWNATGVNLGFNWYCSEVRGSVWNRIVNPAGFTIDWILKTYDPADSAGVTPGSSSGGRNTNLDVFTSYSATLPNSMEQISIDYSVAGSPSLPLKNTNLQLRYEIADTIHNPTTDNNGQATVALNVSTEMDDTPSSDDYTSNGVVVFDPATNVVGATTVVQDLSVVGIDLIAQSSSVIVERTRDGATSTLGASIGYNALPGDILTFSLPAQNRGVLTAPSTVMEIETPDGVVSRSSLPTIAPYAEERVSVDWTVPQDMDIGTSTLNFTVDPDQDVTADTNRTNNDASISIFVGRAPTADLFAEEGKYTFDNVILNATQSFDVDGGDVDCRFEIESRAGLIDVIEAPNCITQWNWSNSGTWEVKVLVIDEELDTDELMVEVEILNRAPSFNLTYPEAGAVESPITIEAVDIQDIDTTSPSGQQVTISWPGLDCAEGTTQPTCTITPMFEGPVNFTAVATDDDGETTTAAGTIEVLNVAPTLEPPQLLVGGEALQPDENGSWHLNEDEVALLRTTASDSENDQGTLIVEWYPSIDDQNWTITSIGTSSSEPVSWSTAGLHSIQVRAIDNDGESSDVQQASVIISNVPPTVTGLPGNTPVFEDDLLNLSVQISDTPSDADSLEVCWDLNAKVDGNNDGVSDNDCELNGTSVSPSWTSVGVRMITVTVTDDDGATAQQSMNVSVLNLPPTALISELSVIEGLVEGDNLTLGGEDSLETETDKTTLAYQWDSSHIDTDLDGQKTGDVDFSGPSWTIEDLPAGTWTIVLTVIDDDGDSSQAELTILVAEAPPEGIFQSITDAVGSTMTAVIGLLGVVIFGLVLFLLFTRGGTSQDEDFGMYEQSSFATAPAQAPASMAPAPTEQPAAAAPQPAAVARPNMDAQPVNTGPPLPASGLPNGWTMEQWNYYGEQWLAANQPAPAPVQPIVSQTQPAPASTELQSLLDDLDF